MNTEGILLLGAVKGCANEFSDVFSALDERWVDGNDSAAANDHFERHTIYGKKTPEDYTIVYPHGYPRTTTPDEVTRHKRFLLQLPDKAAYIRRAEELADAKVDGSICGGFIIEIDGDRRFTKWKKVKLEPAMYYIVSYKRDEDTGEPLIVTFFLADRYGFQANSLKYSIGDLPEDEKSADLSKYANPYNKPSGKIYYQEYAEDGATVVVKEKSFDDWRDARRCFNSHTCVFKAEKYDVHGNLIPGETLTRENQKKLTVNAPGASIDEGVEQLSEAGYDGYSMSNNARAAYENDEKPLSKWSKEDILYCASRINKCKAMLLKKVSLEDLRNHLLTRTSWHHTSSYYNQTDFYSFDEEAYENVHESDINRWVEAHKNDVASRKKETPRIRKGRIDYLVWYGSRAHPKASEEHLDNVNIEERGSFYVITDDSGKEILRKKIGSNGTHVKFYESIDRIDDDLGILAFDNAKEVAYYIRKNASKYLRVSAFEGSAIGGGNVYLVGNMLDVNHGEMVRAAVANGYISKDCSDKEYYDCYAFPSKELDDNYNLYLLLGDFSTYVQFVYDGFLLYCVDDYGDGESFKGTELVKALGPAKSIEKVGLDYECNAVLPYDQIEHDDLDESMNLSGEFLKLATPYMLRNDGALFNCSPMHPYIMRKHEKSKIVGMLKSKDQTKIDALNWFHNNTNNPELRKTIDIVLNYFGIKESGVYKPSEEEILDFIEQANNMGNQEFLRLRTSNMLYGGTDNSLFARISSVDFNWYPLLFDLLMNHKSIESITICKDSNTFGGSFDAYSINGMKCNNLPANEFLCVKGRPIVESKKSEYDVINKAIGCLAKGRPLNEAYDHMHPRYLNGWYETEIHERLEDNIMNSQHPIEEKKRLTEAHQKVHKGVTLNELKSLVDGIYNKLKSIDKPEEELIGGEYYGSAQIFSQRGNALEIITHYTTPGSYYATSITYSNCYAVKIGGAYHYSTYKDELRKLKAMFNYEVVSGWGLSDTVITSDGYEVSLIDCDGTGFSVYGINIRGRHSAKNEGLGEARKPTAVKSNGVYSVMKGEWVKEPSADAIPAVDKRALESELTEWEDRYFEISENPSKEAIDRFIEDVYDLRKASIADGGEYSLGNLVFKSLRDLGYLDDLKDLKRGIVDKELSLESVGN